MAALVAALSTLSPYRLGYPSAGEVCIGGCLNGASEFVSRGGVSRIVIRVSVDQNARAPLVGAYFSFCKPIPIPTSCVKKTCGASFVNRDRLFVRQGADNRLNILAASKALSKFRSPDVIKYNFVFRFRYWNHSHARGDFKSVCYYRSVVLPHNSEFEPIVYPRFANPKSDPIVHVDVGREGELRYVSLQRRGVCGLHRSRDSGFALFDSLAKLQGLVAEYDSLNNRYEQRDATQDTRPPIWGALVLYFAGGLGGFALDLVGIENDDVRWRRRLVAGGIALTVLGNIAILGALVMPSLWDFR